VLDASRQGWLQHHFTVTANIAGTVVVQMSVFEPRVRSFNDVKSSRVLATYAFDSSGRAVSAIAGPAKPATSPEVSPQRLRKVVALVLGHSSAQAWLKKDVTISMGPKNAMFYPLRGSAGDWQFFEIERDGRTVRVHDGY
jgi:hypothetical protein